jgi:hypothetical protein
MINKSAFWTALGVLLGTYSLCLLCIVLLVPEIHGGGFGRASAFQIFASLGKLASFSSLDFTLHHGRYSYGYGSVVQLDDYMLRSAITLTPVFLAWFAMIAFAVQKTCRKFPAHVAYWPVLVTVLLVLWTVLVSTYSRKNEAWAIVPVLLVLPLAYLLHLVILVREGGKAKFTLYGVVHLAMLCVILFYCLTAITNNCFWYGCV